MYKKGDAKISLVELIYIYPNEWNCSVTSVIKWLDNVDTLDYLSIIDLITEIIEIFEEKIYDASKKFDDEDVWHYDDTSTIDENDVIQIMSAF